MFIHPFHQYLNILYHEDFGEAIPLLYRIGATIVSLPHEKSW
jgi:hypothetical protein